MPLGSAVVTSAGRLPFRGIIHVAGINLVWNSTERSIRDSTRNAVNAALTQGWRSRGGGKEERSLNLMLDELGLLEGTLEVVVVKFRPSK